MKWLISICLLLTLILPASVSAAAVNDQQELTLSIDGITIHANPIVIDNSVYIPLRAAMEHLGATVSFSGKQIHIKRQQLELSMTIGQNKVTINGEEVPVTTPPILVKGSTYVPIRFLGNAFGYDVLFQSAEHQVLLHTPGEQAVIYGFAENLDGAVIGDGVVKLINVEPVQR
ncbi:stalk domain-containing protein [Paenibacillus albus]|nr:stalk domain-containing protein [Paenibacillus albus]